MNSEAIDKETLQKYWAAASKIASGVKRLTCPVADRSAMHQHIVSLVKDKGMTNNLRMYRNRRGIFIVVDRGTVYVSYATKFGKTEWAIHDIRVLQAADKGTRGTDLLGLAYGLIAMAGAVKVTEQT